MSNFKKIPDHAKLVFKGVLHDIYQWEQELFDGTFGTFEAIKKRDGVNVLATTPDRKIIINYEEQPNRAPFISLPSGLIEEGQSYLENAQRELEEETGYTSSDWHFWMKVDPLKYGKIEWWSDFYLAKNCVKNGKIKFDGGEKIETHLYSFEDFLKISQDEKFRTREVKDYIKKILDISDEDEKKRELEKLENLIF